MIKLESLFWLGIIIFFSYLVAKEQTLMLIDSAIFASKATFLALSLLILYCLVYLGLDSLICLSLKFESLRQSRVQTKRMEAEIWVIKSKAIMNRAVATSKGTIIKEVTASKALYVLGPGHEKYIPALTALPAEPIEQVEPVKFDLLEVFSQTLQVYAIIGGQQTGKTFQARHVMAAWQRAGAKTWLIGPKWDKGEWQGCRTFGGNNDYSAVNDGLVALRCEASRRHSHPTLGNKEHPAMLVVLDDWTPVVEQCDEAAKFILEATTLFASVNIILLFLIHADTANAWGVGQKGAALKDNFLKLYIIPQFDSAGHVDRIATKGELQLPGDPVRYHVQLISEPVRWPALSIAGQDESVTADNKDRPGEERAIWQNSEISDRDRIYLYLKSAMDVGEDIYGEGFSWRKVKVVLALTGGSDKMSKLVGEVKKELSLLKENKGASSL